jgi:hypothetical protein
MVRASANVHREQQSKRDRSAALYYSRVGLNLGHQPRARANGEGEWRACRKNTIALFSLCCLLFASARHSCYTLFLCSLHVLQVHSSLLQSATGDRDSARQRTDSLSALPSLRWLCPAPKA